MGQLKRDLNPMPEDVRAALVSHGLVDAFGQRPPYQRNDYLGWISNAKREDTRAKRLRQMVDELTRGGVYMNMDWAGEANTGGG